MEFCNFDDVFDYASYASGKESSTPEAGGHSALQSDPREWSKYCRHIDNFLYYGVDSPILPPETNLAQPRCSPPTLPSSLPTATMGPFPRQDVLASWPNDDGPSLQPQSQPRLGSSQLSTAGCNSDRSTLSAGSFTPETLIECSPLSPQVAPYEHGDEHSRMKPSSEGLERGTLIPDGMLIEFQVDKAAWLPDPPTLPQPSAPPSTTRDCRCNCLAPITDWARHWRRSCPGNPARSFPCSNGCGKSFTRKDNMKRHISLGECSLC